MNKKKLTERDICTKFITPAVMNAGWDVMSQIREQVFFTKGRIIVRGKLVTRGKAKFADHILYYKPNIPIALIEATDNNHPVGGGMQQGLDYATTLDIPFVFSSNGDAFLFHDRTGLSRQTETELALDERTRRVAHRVSEFLKESGDRFQKTIVFCVDTEHAARMRQALVNENPDLVQQNSRYVMRITGDDAEGCAQIGNFIDPEAKYPVIVTTSRLLSTGVDAQTCRLIVLDRAVGSMTEFKQIMGRGTRVHEDTRKYYFTLLDFRRATNHFADPDFDGVPVQIYEPGEDDPINPPDDAAPPEDVDDPILPEPGEDEVVIVDPIAPVIDIPIAAEARPKFYIHGKIVTILAERIEYLDENGKLVTESLRDYSKKHCGSNMPASMLFSSAGRAPSASRRSLRNSPPRAFCSIRWPTRWARTSTRST